MGYEFVFYFQVECWSRLSSPQVPAIVQTALQVNGNVQNVINVFNIIPRITMSGISCWYFTWIWTCCLWRIGIQIHPNTASTIASCRSNRQAIRGGSVRPPSKHLSIFITETQYQYRMLCTVYILGWVSLGTRRVYIPTQEEMFECAVCGKHYRRRALLSEHLRTHTGEKPYDCTMCNKKFLQNSNLKSHLRTHTGEKPFECKVCGKRFSESTKLNNHLRIHSREKPYQCTVCKKNFTERGNLKNHIRIHTGERPYECKTCGKSFPCVANQGFWPGLLSDGRAISQANCQPAGPTGAHSRM